MIVCDTGPLVAAGDRDEEHNRSCTDLFTGLHLAGRPILVPAPVVAEVGYLFQRGAGPTTEAAFLRSLASGTLQVVDLLTADYERMADLVEQYADFPLGTTDAAVVAVSERLGVTKIATLDHRHFRAVRPAHVRDLHPPAVTRGGPLPPIQVQTDRCGGLTRGRFGRRWGGP